MNTTARLTHQSLRFDTAVRSHLVVSLTAPPLDAGAKRPPVLVIPVLDVSGSMQGDKLFMAKQSLLKLVEHLGPGDRCGVVAFSTDVFLVSPAVEMTPDAKARLKLQVGELSAQAQTNLSGGLLEGLGLANGTTLPDGTLVRVILFTDGHANHGLATTGEQLLPLLDAHRGRATVSAFGYGRDTDQELLSDLAQRGGGNYAFISGPDAAMSAFARELGGLLSTYATDLEVQVTPAPGVRVVSVLSDVDSQVTPTGVALRADDILAEEERHLVLGVELEPLASPATTAAFQVEVRYTVLGGGTPRRESAALAVSVDRVEPPLAQTRPDPAIDVLVAQAQLLQAQLAAEVHARAGRYDEAVTTLHQMSMEMSARGHHGVAAAARTLIDKVADARRFEGSGAMRKSMQSGMRRGSSSGREDEAERLFDLMGKKVRTKAQDDMDDSFGGPKGDPAAPPTPPRRPRPGSGPGRGSSPGTGGDGLNRRRSRRW